MPAIACWADYCYGQASHLRFGDRVLPSTCGVQQGDPLHPLLFALALQPALRAAAAHPVDLCFSYLDDVVIAGPAHHVARAMRDLVAEARRAGLLLEPQMSAFSALTRLQTFMLLFPSGLPVVATRCFELLGAPIGPDAFCQHYSSQTVDKATAVPDPQTALLLLRHCVSYTKLTYSMRVTPPAMHAQALQAFDDRVRACLEQLGGWLLPMGGLGLRGAAHHAPAAFLASASATATHCQGLDPQYVLAWPVLTDATSRYNLAAPAHDQFSQPCTQQHLSACLDKARLSSLLDAASCESARALRLLQQAGAGSWLHARPCEALGLHIEPHLFQVLLRLRLRLPVASSDGFCPLCDGTADRFGDHARTCPCGGDRCKQHNRLRSVLAAKAGAAGLSQRLKKRTSSLPGRKSPGAVKRGLQVVRPALGAPQMSMYLSGACMAPRPLTLPSLADSAHPSLLPPLLMGPVRLRLMKIASASTRPPPPSAVLRACNSSLLLPKRAGAGGALKL